MTNKIATRSVPPTLKEKRVGQSPTLQAATQPRGDKGAISPPLYRVNCWICAHFMVIIASVKLVSSGAI